MSEDVRICFVGDSFVNGTGDETTLGWVGRLCAAANRATQITCYNLGVRRDTSRDILRRWQRECALRLPEGCDARIVLSGGVNDTVIEDGRTRVPPDESRENLRAVLRGAERYWLLVVGPPPVGEARQDERIRTLAAAFAEEAAALGVPYIDLFGPLCADRDYLAEVARNDGAHPRSSGYAKIAGIIGASRHWWFRAACRTTGLR